MVLKIQTHIDFLYDCISFEKSVEVLFILLESCHSQKQHCSSSNSTKTCFCCTEGKICMGIFHITKTWCKQQNYALIIVVRFVLTFFDKGFRLFPAMDSSMQIHGGGWATRTTRRGES